MFSNDNGSNSFETVPKLSLQVELGITGRNEGDRNEGSAGQNKHPTDVRLRARLRIGLGSGWIAAIGDYIRRSEQVVRTEVGTGGRSRV